MTTNRYISVNRPFNRLQGTGVTVATSSTSADEVELRVSIETSGGHKMTTYETIMALKAIERVLIELGKTGSGANLPIGAPGPA